MVRTDKRQRRKTHTAQQFVFRHAPCKHLFKGGGGSRQIFSKCFCEMAWVSKFFRNGFANGLRNGFANEFAKWLCEWLYEVALRKGFAKCRGERFCESLCEVSLRNGFVNDFAR